MISIYAHIINEKHSLTSTQYNPSESLIAVSLSGVQHTRYSRAMSYDCQLAWHESGYRRRRHREGGRVGAGRSRRWERKQVVVVVKNGEQRAQEFV